MLEVFGDRWLKERVLAVAALPKFEVLTFAVGGELRVADLTGSALNRLGTDANLFASNGRRRDTGVVAAANDSRASERRDPLPFAQKSAETQLCDL